MYHWEMEQTTADLPQLPDIIPTGAFIGAGLILHDRGRFLFGIRPTRWDGMRPIAEITAIGGRIEAHDASLTEGVQREACEEIDCHVRLIPSARTLVVRGPQDFEWLSLGGEERPAAVVFRFYKAPPHQPWSMPGPDHPAYRPPSCIVLFQAELEGEPQPSEELPALIWLTPGQILETASRDVLFSELLAHIGLKRLREEYPPADIWARLTDSHEALALSLGEETYAYFQSLVQK